MATRSKNTSKSSSDTAATSDEEHSLRAEFESLKTLNESFKTLTQQEFVALKASNQESMKNLEDRLVALMENMAAKFSSQNRHEPPIDLADSSQGEAPRVANRGKAPMGEASTPAGSLPAQRGKIELGADNDKELNEKFSFPTMATDTFVQRKEYFEPFAPPPRDNRFRGEHQFRPENERGFQFRQEVRPRPNFDFNQRDEDAAYWGQYRGDARVRKLEMPIFSGTNVNQWVYKAERYFQVNNLSEHEAISAATLCLEDKAFD